MKTRNRTPTRVRRTDSIPVDKTYFTAEGYLVDHPILTSIGIFEYHEPNGKIRRELRLPNHVFAADSLASYEGKPVIITHNAGMVTKANVAEEMVGTILSCGEQDGDDVRAKIIIHDIDAVKDWGLRELSLGYDTKLDPTPGVWEGEPYDAIQTEITINHLAIVGEARAGEQARLNLDGKSGLKGTKIMRKQRKSMRGDALRSKFGAKKRRHDGKPPSPNPAPETVEEKIKLILDRRDRRDEDGDLETVEELLEVLREDDDDIKALVEIIEELQETLDDADEDDPGDEDEAPDRVSADADEDREDEDESEIPDREDEDGDGNDKKNLNEDDIDEIIRERLELEKLGEALNLAGLGRKRPIEAKRAIVAAVNPKLRLDGKPTSYIETAFDICKSGIKPSKSTDSQRAGIHGRTDSASASGKSAAETARDRMIRNMGKGGN